VPFVTYFILRWLACKKSALAGRRQGTGNRGLSPIVFQLQCEGNRLVWFFAQVRLAVVMPKC
jgi:hypothetical protein